MRGESRRQKPPRVATCRSRSSNQTRGRSPPLLESACMRRVQKPQVSVCIPCHNDGRFLSRAIKSALAQSSYPIEVIVVDDASEDESAQVTLGFRRGVRLIQIDARDASVARNVGLAAASGNFIQFLDADDYLLPGRFDVVVPALERDAADLVFTDFTIRGEDGQSELRESPEYAPAEDAFVWTLRHNHIGQRAAIGSCAPLHKREWLRHVGGFRPGVRWGEDKDLVHRLCAAGARLLHIPGSTYVWRHHDGARISNLKRPMGYAASFLVGLSERLLNGDEYCLDEHRRVELARCLWRAASEAYKCGARHHAAAAFRMAVRLAPSVGPQRGRGYRRVSRVLGPMAAERIAHVLRQVRGRRG